MIELTAAEATHLELLEQWRKVMNLVGPGPVDEHFEDAARAVGWTSFEGRWADLGSGAGFPGIALAARHPQAEVTLVESRRKRATFLDEVVARAALPNASVICTRSERLDPCSFEGVISRAYRPPPDYLDQARDLVVPGGQVLLLVARQKPIEIDGLALFHVERYALGERPREVHAYRRS